MFQPTPLVGLRPLSKTTCTVSNTLGKNATGTAVAKQSVPHVFNDEVDVIAEVITKLYNRFLWGRKFFRFYFLFFIHCKSWTQRQHSRLLDRRTVTQQQPTFPRCLRLLWPAATGDVDSPAMAKEMSLNYKSRKYVITEEFVNVHMLRVGEIPTCLSSFGRSSVVL